MWALGRHGDGRKMIAAGRPGPRSVRLPCGLPGADPARPSGWFIVWAYDTSLPPGEAFMPQPKQMRTRYREIVACPRADWRYTALLVDTRQ